MRLHRAKPQIQSWPVAVLLAVVIGLMVLGIAGADVWLPVLVLSLALIGLCNATECVSTTIRSPHAKSIIPRPTHRIARRDTNRR